MPVAAPSAADVDNPETWQPPDSDAPVQSWQPPANDVPVQAWTPPQSDAPVAPVKSRPNPFSLPSLSDVNASIKGSTEKGLGYVGGVAKAIPADIAQTISGDEPYYQLQNLASAALGDKQLPIQQKIDAAASDAPGAATLANVSQGLAESAPLLATGALNLPAIASKAVALGFSGQMIAGVKDLATQYGAEMGKPESERDPAKLAQLRAGLISTGIFAPLAGAHGATGISDIIKPSIENDTTTPEQSTPQIQNQPAVPSVGQPPEIVTGGTDGATSDANAAQPAVEPPTSAPSDTGISQPVGENGIQPAPATPSKLTEPDGIHPFDSGDRTQQFDYSPENLEKYNQLQSDLSALIPKVVDDPAALDSLMEKQSELEDLKNRYNGHAPKNLESSAADETPSEVDAIIKKSAAKANPQANLKPGGLTPNDLEPVVDINGKIYSGGDTHADVIVKNDLLDTPDIMTTDKYRKFRNKNTGQVIGRREASDALGLEYNLDSETLNSLKQKSPTMGLGAENTKNAPVAEAKTPAQSPTAMKYRLIDQERQQRGLPPISKPESVSDEATFAKATDAIDKNPNLPDQLVDELNKKPRSISDVENHVLLFRKIDLRNQYEKASSDLIKANEAGDKDGVQSANVRVADASDKLNDLENASRLSGSERGRSLRSLQVMANEDYSLAGLETRLRASKGGAPLTDAERAGLVKTAADYKKANDELSQHLADRDKQIADLHAKAALDQIALESKKANSPAAPKRAGLLDTLKARADAARARINARPTQLSAGIDPTLLLKSLKDEIEIGAYHIARIGADVAKWTAKNLDAWKESMKKEFGDRIVPHLATILDAAKKTVDDLNKSPTHEEKVVAISGKIKEKFAAGKNDEITSQVQKLARAFIERGITGRDALIDAVHNVLKESYPEITRREAMDAISGYGDFKQLSKDEISVKLRGLKGEMQQVAKLEDMQEGIPPSKTGIERRTPTDEERKLIKAVNESKLKFQTPITDPLRQLKSALDTKKTQLANSIKDMQAKIDSGDFSKRPKRALVLDRKAQELTAQKEAVAKKFKKLQRDYEKAQLPSASKSLDFISNLRRFSVLSGVNVLGKLGAYSATKFPVIGITEAVGSALSKLPKLSEIAAKAPSESSTSLGTVIRSMSKAFTKGIIDAYQTGTKGQSKLKEAFSTRPETGRDWYNFFQTVHEVIKSPLRRATFELSLAKRMESAARHNIDPNDPVIQLALSKDAYLDSDRALLLENNRFANGIRLLMRNLEAKNKTTGQVPLGGKIGATIGRVELPILSVPLNYVKQTLVSAFGLVSGSIKARNAFKNGIENLEPREADEILRHLKYGSIGGALLLYGFYDGYKNGSNGTLGGFYQPGEKRKDNQTGVGGLRIGGHNIPGLALHNPMIAVAQLGHTMGAILASKLNKKTDQTHSVPVATVAAMMGLLNQSPLGNTVELASQLSDPRSAEYAMGEHVKGLVVPQLVQEAANYSDQQNGKLVKRNPTTITQHVETGIPGLRQTVPVKRKQ